MSVIDGEFCLRTAGVQKSEPRFGRHTIGGASCPRALAFAPFSYPQEKF